MNSKPRAIVVDTKNAPPIPENRPWKLTALKSPDTLELEHNYPVIVWGDYTYWPFSYRDNRLSMCLVAYDSLNNVVKSWDLSGARYIVSISVDPFRQEITLLGQTSRTITLSWNDITLQYFWIINRASNLALTSEPHSNQIHLRSRAVDDAQLWLLDQAIFPKTNSTMCLDYNPPSPTDDANEEIPIRLAEASGDNTQEWIIDPSTGYLKPAAGTTTTDLVATWRSSDDSIVLQGVFMTTSSSNQLWDLKPYVHSTDLSTNQFPYLIVGDKSPFKLSNQGQLLSTSISAGSGASLTLLPNTDTSKSSQWFHNGNGVLVNVQNGLAITATSESSSIIGNSPMEGCLEQQWSLTSDGNLVCKANGCLMLCCDNHVVLSNYDALHPVNQTWLLQHIQAGEATSSHNEILSQGSTPVNQTWLLQHIQEGEATSPHNEILSKGSIAWSNNITELTVMAVISNDLWAGTSDTISISFGATRDFYSQLLFKNPSRGDTVTIAIDLKRMFAGKSAINLLDDVKMLQIWQYPTTHPIASDSWKLESIILKAKDSTKNIEFTNYAFGRVNKWLDNNSFGPKIVWSSLIPWGGWKDADQKPIDSNGKTYDVGWIPYIGDILAWRNYDPSTIDGVGQIIGMQNGNIIGERLKPPQMTEILQLTDDRYSYTWVLTPNHAMIYKKWDKKDKINYVRHSQLGSGNPVICAGEMQIARAFDSNVITDVFAIINDASGHYKPDGGACLDYVAQKLQDLSVPTNNIKWYFRS